jgi:hypothetical protein
MAKKKTSKYGPCPFCGRKTSYSEDYDGDYWRCCSNAWGCGASTRGRDQHEANERWKARAGKR